MAGAVAPETQRQPPVAPNLTLDQWLTDNHKGHALGMKRVPGLQLPHHQHDWRLVVVAGLVCFLASLTAITLFNQARVKVGRARAIWIMAAGCAAGCGIWATHFLAMLAYDPGISIAYGIGLTALSLIAAASVTAAGLGIAAAYPTPGGAAAGGGIVGAGVACMHYLGMWALEVPGHVSWEPEPRRPLDRARDVARHVRTRGGRALERAALGVCGCRPAHARDRLPSLYSHGGRGDRARPDTHATRCRCRRPRSPSPLPVSRSPF